MFEILKNQERIAEKSWGYVSPAGYGDQREFPRNLAHQWRRHASKRMIREGGGRSKRGALMAHSHLRRRSHGSDGFELLLVRFILYLSLSFEFETREKSSLTIFQHSLTYSDFFHLIDFTIIHIDFFLEKMDYHNWSYLSPIICLRQIIISEREIKKCKSVRTMIKSSKNFSIKLSLFLSSISNKKNKKQEKRKKEKIFAFTAKNREWNEQVS